MHLQIRLVILKWNLKSLFQPFVLTSIRVRTRNRKPYVNLSTLLCFSSQQQYTSTFSRLFKSTALDIARR